MADPKKPAEPPILAAPAVAEAPKPAETKAEATTRHDAEAAQIAKQAADDRATARRLSGYSSDSAPDTDHLVSAARLHSHARVILALIRADSSKDRQAIADAYLDDLDSLLESKDAKPAVKPKG